MMNKFLAVIAFFIAIQFTQAQDYKFGKISKEELQEESNPLDNEANASVLYRKQYIHFQYREGSGFVQINEIHERIKIYNKDGFDQATKTVHLYNKTNSDKETISGLKAYTYNLEGGKIVDSKLKKDGIFDEVTNKYWKSMKFTMPNVKKGSVIEYKYVIDSPLLAIDDIDIQQTIPIKKIDFRLEIPEYFNYKKHVNPKATFYPKMNESTKSNKVNLTTKTRSGVKISQTSFSTSTINYKENVVAINETNIPALKNEPMVSYLNNYKAQVRFELNYIKFPNEPVENYATTWERVSKKIYEYPEFGDQLKKSGYYEDDVNEILRDVNDPFVKTILLFDFVKSKVKWNEMHGYYTDEGVRKAYKEGAGNVADINLMLVSMLRYAGLDANPVLVSTKNNGIPLFPTRNGFNYVVCNVVLAGNNILLDASTEFSKVNILPLKILNWQGRLIRKDGTSSWVKLNPNKPSKEIRSLNVKINSNFSVSGKVRNQYTDYQELNYRNKYKNHSIEEIIESLEKDNGEIEISNLEVKNREDLSKPIVQSYEYKHTNAIEQIGGKLYFSPLLFLTSEENPFKLDSRNYPIDFIYPIADKYMVNIMLPKGYAVETLPKNSKSQFNDQDGEFTYLVRQNGNTLQIIMTLNLNKTLILSSEYEVFKQFYQMMIDKQTEKIVLKKAI